MVAGGYPVQGGHYDPSEVKDDNLPKADVKDNGDAATGGNEPPPVRCSAHLVNAHALPLKAPCVSYLAHVTPP